MSLDENAWIKFKSSIYWKEFQKFLDERLKGSHEILETDENAIQLYKQQGAVEEIRVIQLFPDAMINTLKAGESNEE